MQREGDERSPKRLRAGDACAASLPPPDQASRTTAGAGAAVQQQQRQSNEEGPTANPPPCPPPELAVGALGSLLSLHAQFHCDVCGADISGTFRIRCAECKDFDLCLSCFCSGRTNSSGGAAKQQQHKNTHAYIPVGRNRFPVFTLDWTAEEEILLVEGVSKYGFGNWLEVAELVCHASLEPKTPDQCEKHYMGVYLNSAASPLPDLSALVHGPDGAALTPEEAKARREAEKQTQVESEPVGGSSSPTPLARKSPKPSHSIVGYWPLRGDFDVEFDNDAELILADMEFKGPKEREGLQCAGHQQWEVLYAMRVAAEGEAVQERQLKLQIIEIYNSKLDERIYRKNTIISRGLLDVKSLHLRDKKRTKEERDLHNLFKPLARFQSDEQQERLVQLLIEERRVRNRLALLHEWRSLGLKTAKDVEIYEEEKAWREQLRTRSPDLCLSAATPGSIHAAAASAVVTAAGSSTKAQLATTGKGRAGQRGGVAASASSGPGPAAAAGGAPLTPIKNFPGAKLLKPEELAFCEEAQLPPVFFLLAKRMLVHEVSVHRKNDGKGLNKPVQLLVHRVGQLYDFYVNMWQFASCPQAIAAHPEGAKESVGGPSEGDPHTTSAQQDPELPQLPQFVHPGVSRPFMAGDEDQQAATSNSSSFNAEGALAHEQAVG